MWVQGVPEKYVCTVKHSYEDETTYLVVEEQCGIDRQDHQ